MADEALVAEMQAKLDERPDLMERLRSGDTSALAEIFEYVNGTTTSK